MLYYAKIDGQILGPMSYSELVSLRKAGTLHDNAFWNSDSSEGWKPAAALASEPVPSTAERSEWLVEMGSSTLARVGRNFLIYIAVCLFLGLILYALQSFTHRHQEANQTPPTADGR